MGRQDRSSARSSSVFSSSSSRSRTHICACRMPAQNTTWADVLRLGFRWEKPSPRPVGSVPQPPEGESCLMDSGESDAQVCPWRGSGGSGWLHAPLGCTPGWGCRLSPKQTLRNSTGLGRSERLLSPIIHRVHGCECPRHNPIVWLRGRRPGCAGNHCALEVPKASAGQQGAASPGSSC